MTLTWTSTVVPGTSSPVPSHWRPVEKLACRVKVALGAGRPRGPLNPQIHVVQGLGF